MKFKVGDRVRGVLEVFYENTHELQVRVDSEYVVSAIAPDGSSYNVDAYGFAAGDFRPEYAISPTALVLSEPVLAWGIYVFLEYGTHPQRLSSVCEYLGGSARGDLCIKDNKVIYTEPK